ncbi:plasmid mobilization protein [Pseudomonas chlororaphis]|uniref:plasmid mobilization protein n=1 Tax=Pseudomonas chlororaphis TaxID=587753 RepID=UPI0039832DD7
MAESRSQKPKKPKTRVLAFRVPEGEFAEYEEKLLSAGLDTSKFLREAFRNFNVTFEAPSKDYERLLFLYNKSSNNLNQLAYRVNSAHRRSEIISESLYIKWLNELVLIRELLMAGVNHVD